jgi:hypothetical protein
MTTKALQAHALRLLRALSGDDDASLGSRECGEHSEVWTTSEPDAYYHAVGETPGDALDTLVSDLRTSLATRRRKLDEALRIEAILPSPFDDTARLARTLVTWGHIDIWLVSKQTYKGDKWTAAIGRQAREDFDDLEELGTIRKGEGTTAEMAVNNLCAIVRQALIDERERLTEALREERP